MVVVVYKLIVSNFSGVTLSLCFQIRVFKYVCYDLSELVRVDTL